MRWWQVAASLLLGLAAGLLLALGSEADDARRLQIRFSRFEPAVITVRAGESVTLLLENRDPIEHEWIVGPEEVHERHRRGSEAFHGSIPTEVTLPPFASRRTTVAFEEPGDYAFICHLPGHEAYGMRGILRVVPR